MILKCYNFEAINEKMPLLLSIKRIKHYFCNIQLIIITEYGTAI